MIPSTFFFSAFEKLAILITGGFDPVAPPRLKPASGFKGGLDAPPRAKPDGLLPASSQQAKSVDSPGGLTPVSAASCNKGLGLGASETFITSSYLTSGGLTPVSAASCIKGLGLGSSFGSSLGTSFGSSLGTSYALVAVSSSLLNSAH